MDTVQDRYLYGSFLALVRKRFGGKSWEWRGSPSPTHQVQNQNYPYPKSIFLLLWSWSWTQHTSGTGDRLDMVREMWSGLVRVLGEWGSLTPQPSNHIPSYPNTRASQIPPLNHTPINTPLLHLTTPLLFIHQTIDNIYILYRIMHNTILSTPIP